MPTSAGSARFGVRFDELAFSEDIRHATPVGRQVAGAAHQRLQADGADPSEFKRCDPDARWDEPGELPQGLPPHPGWALADGRRPPTATRSRRR
jgi:hypothetical protein